MRLLSIGVVLSIMIAGAPGMTQTTLNPEISLIGDIRAFSHSDDARPGERDELNLADPELELFVSGYLNPYARAAGNIAWHPGVNAEVEELYAEFIRGLPLRAQLRAGKYLLEFGRLNPIHPHAWSFIQRPLPHLFFFGDEGLSDVAVRASFLLPTGSAYTEVMTALLKGNALLRHSHEHEENDATLSARHAGESLSLQDEHDEESDVRTDLGFFARITTSLALTQTAELALGLSTVNSVYAIEEFDEPVVQETDEPAQLRSWVSGIDLKYRYRPSRYTALQIEAEALWRADETDDGDHINSCGGYGYLDYRFRQRYNAGGIFEYITLTELNYEGGEPIEESRDLWRAGLFLGFAPVEETSLLRLVGHWTEPEKEAGFWELALQLVFSLGPHQPHNF